jgi:hypothetical protein
MNMPLLRFGSQGPYVQLLQLSLNESLSSFAHLVVDGIFGQKTLGGVRGFQTKQHLAVDGIVGPKTHAELAAYYAYLKYLISQLTPPSVESARKRVTSASLAHHTLWGWPQTEQVFKPAEFSPRIAGSEWSNEDMKLRQGGSSLRLIFQIAGAPGAEKCLNLSQKAWDMYHRKGIWTDRKHTAKERNTIDIVSWCGLLCPTHIMCRA